MEMVPATTAAFTRDAAWHFRKCGKPVFLFAWGIGDGSASAQPSRQFGPIHHEPAQTSLKRALNQLWSGIFRYKCVTIRNFGCFFESWHIFPSPKTIRGYKSAHFQGKCLKKHTPEPKAMCHDPKFWPFFRIVTQNKRHGQYRKSRSKACSGKGGAGAQIAWAVPERAESRPATEARRALRGGEGMRKAGALGGAKPNTRH
mgnify:FL=1